MATNNALNLPEGLIGQLVRNTGTGFSNSTATFADTYAINTLLYASGANAITGLATSASAVLTTVASVPTWVSQLPLALGGTNANLTADNGAIVYSTASAFGLLAHTTTAGLALLSGNAAAPTWSVGKPITKVAVQRFTSGSGTYTPTTGMTYCIVECTGAGGGGGGLANSSAGTASGAGSGGGGAYIRSWVSAATIGASQAYTVGALGTGGAAGDNNGNAGGDTSLGAIVIAKGGGGGTGISGGAGGSGGSSAASTGEQKIAGSSGGSGYIQGIITITITIARQGVSVYGAQNNVGCVTSTTNGVPGGTFGCGGAGGVTWNGTGAASGGDGANGLIIITEFIST